MKHQYDSSKDNIYLIKLLSLTLLVGLLYAGMFLVFPDKTPLDSPKKISQIVSLDSISKEKLNHKVITILSSREEAISSDSPSNDRASYQEESQAFKFLGAILQLLLNLYRL